MEQGKDKHANPLQAYPLSVLRFIGTLSRGNIIFAFIMSPDQMVYQVKQGDMIGDRNGKIISIYPDRINVMEQDTTFGTQSVQRIVTLQLKEEGK